MRLLCERVIKAHLTISICAHYADNWTSGSVKDSRSIVCFIWRKSLNIPKAINKSNVQTNTREYSRICGCCRMKSRMKRLNRSLNTYLPACTLPFALSCCSSWCWHCYIVVRLNPVTLLAHSPKQQTLQFQTARGVYSVQQESQQKCRSTEEQESHLTLSMEKLRRADKAGCKCTELVANTFPSWLVRAIGHLCSMEVWVHVLWGR